MIDRLSDQPPASRPPVILLTAGDPAGIGPEIVASAWAATDHLRARLRIVGSGPLVAAVLDRRGVAHPAVRAIRIDDPRPSRPDELLVVEPAAAERDAAAIPDARITAAGGRAAAAAVETAAAAVRAGRAAALVTGPLNKEALHAAGCDVPGHTELLARACGLPDDAASMMLWLPAAAGGSGGLGVVHVTLHEPLRAALARLSPPLIEAAGRRLDAVLRRLLGRPPRLAVAAVNPHGGEGGLFGDEEPRLVEPAVRALAAAGCDVAGPLPADTLFLRAAQGEFDGVVALYHDQGHIPVKLLGMHRSVNITLGLPLVRTSVAHGTAFDIVGTGRADPASLLAAIDAARRLVAPADIRAASGPSS
jgi:4-hydroxythreonine-4-phosphate dehydrogenase